MTVDLGRVGIWSRELRYNRPGARRRGAELEDSGNGPIFIRTPGATCWAAVEHLLAATRRMAFATEVLNIWMHDPAEVASRRASLAGRSGAAPLLGAGEQPCALVEKRPGRALTPARTPKMAEVPGRSGHGGSGAREDADAGCPRPRMYPSRGRGRRPRTPTCSARALRPRRGRALGPASRSPRAGRGVLRRSAARPSSRLGFVNDYLALPNYCASSPPRLHR